MQGGADISPGMEVTSRDGHRIGHVKETLPDGRYFRVDARFAPDLYVPLDAVHDTSEGVVRLKVTHAESTNLGWEARPSQ